MAHIFNRTVLKKSNWIVLYCLAIAFIVLLYRSTSSPIYPMNLWVDSNAALTIGRGMINGTVVYRDLFDHRGPYFYFIHAIAALMSDHSFTGVFILEVIFSTIFLYFSYKTLLIYLPEKAAIFGLPLLSLLIYHSKAFAVGDSPEEFILPFITLSFYYLLLLIHGYERWLGNKFISILNGFAFGAVFWIKFNATGFWIGWILIILFFLISERCYSEILTFARNFLAGFILSCLPVILYFSLTSAWSYLIESYFIVNIFYYPTSNSLLTPIKTYIENIYLSLIQDFSFALTLAGIILFGFVGKNKRHRLERLTPFVCFMFLSLGVYFGRVAPVYYRFVFLAFIILAFVMISQALAKKFLLDKLNLRDVIMFSLLLLILISTVSFTISGRIGFSRMKRADLAQYKIGKIIKEKEDASLLNYFFIDGGFYLGAETIPNVRFFQKANLSYIKFPQMQDEQKRYIEDGVIDFIVTRSFEENDKHQEFILDQGYLLVQAYGQEDFTFFLYQLKDH